MSEIEIDKIYCGDSTEVLKIFPDDCIDLTVTSPPYDNLRTYNGFVFDFETIAKELYRITKSGGVVVWVVGDATINGSETGTSFRQALYFMGCGFNLHDTMVWNKDGFSAVGSLKWRYAPVFEFMFIFAKGSIKTFNPIIDRRNKHVGNIIHGTVRNSDGSMKSVVGAGQKVTAKSGQRFNIWTIFPQGNDTGHPAPFPEALAHDHILSWSNLGDLVLDCFAGSGTTLKMAKETGRHWIGIEISEEYCKLCQRRVDSARVPLFTEA